MSDSTRKESGPLQVARPSLDPATDLSLGVDPAGTSTWSWDIPSGAVTWSKGDGLAGLPPGGFAGTYAAYLELVHPEDRAHFEAVITRTLAGEDEYVMTHRVLWPDGSAHWIDGRGRLTRHADGSPLVLDGVAWNAAGRKRAEGRILHLNRVQAVASAVTKELLRVRSDLEAFDHACRIAVEHGHFCFAWVGVAARPSLHVVPMARAGDEQGYLDEVVVMVDDSPYGEGPVGRAIREGAHRVVNDLASDPTFSPWHGAAHRRGYRGCAAFPLERGGEVIGALCIYAAEENRFDAQQVELLLSLAEDIGFTLDAIAAEARRGQAEAAMRSSEERYRALVEQAADAIFIATPDDRLVEVNAATCTMTGYAREELLGRKLTDLLEPTGPKHPRVTLGQAPGSRVAGEKRFKRRDGAVIDAEVTATVLADGRVQCYARDVTQRKLVQQQLILADRLASLGRLAAGVAHEVNNPLAYLALNLERIEHAAEAASVDVAKLTEIRSAAAEARDGAERVRAVVRALGTLGRDDDAPVGAVDVHRVLDTAVRLAENRARQRGRIVKQYGASRSVRGHELRLGQVFVNLLVNATDALREEDIVTNEIRVRTFDEAGLVVIEVSDNGVGIPEDLLGRIFDPFFTTKPVGEGTGLGLAISHGIVGSFGGSITVESEVAKGTVLRVALIAEPVTAVSSPHSHFDDASAAAPPLDAHAPVDATFAASRVRVLIVDDEPRLAQVLALSLDRHDVVIATSGRAALTLCQARVFDCIFCDLMMPDVSGIDVHAELAREGLGLERRIVFMTGGAFTSRARDFVASVPNLVLEKPFTIERLERAISEIVARRPSAEGLLDP